MAAKQQDTFHSIAFALSFLAVWMVSFLSSAMTERLPSQVPFGWLFSVLGFKTTTKGLSQQPMPNAIG